MSLELRPYQVESVDGVRKLFSKGKKKVLLHLPTGAGKTEIFIEIARGTLAKGNRCWVITRGRELCFNAQARFEKRGIPSSLLMGGLKYDQDSLCSVISISTWQKRFGLLKHAPKLIIIDEAHQAASPQYHDLVARFPDAYYLCVTATPWQTKSIKHVAEVSLAPICYKKLVEQGFLLPPKVFTPFTPNLKGVKKKNGEYDDDELMAVVADGKVYGNIAEHYVKTAKKTMALCFCVNVRHSEEMRDYFMGQGIRAAMLNAESPREERERTIALLKSGELDVITNCNILSTGVDIPELRTIISARPTKSRILWVQQCGRGARLFPGKEFFYLMDHANNTIEHGFIDYYAEPMLDGKPKRKPKEGEPDLLPSGPTMKMCDNCFLNFPATALNCPQCGWENLRKAEENPEDADLKEITGIGLAKKIVQDAHWSMVYELTEKAFVKGYRRGWIFRSIEGVLGYQAAKQYSSRAVVDAITYEVGRYRFLQGLEEPRGFRTDP